MAAICCALRSPSSPVAALAQPEFTTTPEAWPSLLRSISRETITGAAANPFWVNTAAVGHAPPSTTHNPTSRRPLYLISPDTPAQRKPAGSAKFVSETGTLDVI